MELARARVLTNVVTIVNAISRGRRIREPAAQAHVRRPSRAAIRAEGAEVFRIIVGNKVCPAHTYHAGVVARIVKAHCHRAVCGIERDIRQKLAVDGRVVVHAHRRAPRRAIIGRGAHHDVRVVALVD